MDTFTGKTPEFVQIYPFTIIYLGPLFRGDKTSSEQLPWLSLHLLVQGLRKDFKPIISTFTIILPVQFLLSYLYFVSLSILKVLGLIFQHELFVFDTLQYLHVEFKCLK